MGKSVFLRSYHRHVVILSMIFYQWKKCAFSKQNALCWKIWFTSAAVLDVIVVRVHFSTLSIRCHGTYAIGIELNSWRVRKNNSQQKRLNVHERWDKLNVTNWWWWWFWWCTIHSAPSSFGMVIWYWFYSREMLYDASFWRPEKHVKPFRPTLQQANCNRLRKIQSDFTLLESNCIWCISVRFRSPVDLVFFVTEDSRVANNKYLMKNKKPSSLVVHENQNSSPLPKKTYRSSIMEIRKLI